MKNKMPLGLKIILAFSILAGFWSSWSMIQGTYQYNTFMPDNLDKIAGYIFWATNLAWIIAIFKRYKWGWKLFIVTNFLSAISAVLGEIIQGFNLASIAVYLTLILMVAMSVYVYKVRAYFNR